MSQEAEGAELARTGLRNVAKADLGVLFTPEFRICGVCKLSFSFLSTFVVALSSDTSSADALGL